jgi:signal transduction histidine kinase
MRDTFNDMLANIERNEEVLEQAVILKTKELNQALEGSQSANRYKANIMSTVSHEMKNPLHSIQTGIDLLFDGIPETSADYPSYREHHNRSKMLVQELVRHIDAILINAKLNAHEYKKNYTLVHLDDFMAERRVGCQHLCLKNGNNLAVEGEKGISIKTDRLLLRYIVDNLLDNACKFTNTGNIILRWGEHQDGFFIEVEDTGCGMSQQNIDIIFDEFKQIDMSLTRRYRGFGLGLAITRQSAQLLDGDIKVTSQEGKGSLFQVAIPKNGQG